VVESTLQVHLLGLLKFLICMGSSPEASKNLKYGILAGRKYTF
jgi:hypothetical protein